MPSGYAFRRLWRCSHVAAAAIWGAMWKTVPDVMRVSCADPRKPGGYADVALSLSTARG